MKIEGSKWGIGSNSIHFIDLFSYFSRCNDFKFVEIQLENIVLDSKRKGYKEFIGRLEGRNSRGDSLELICTNEGDGPYTIKIQNGPEEYFVTFNSLDHIDFKSSNGLSSRIGKVTLPYQSEMTNIWVKDILTKGSCDLPTYSSFMNLHLEVIRVFTDHLKKITGEKIEACPIT